MTPKLTGIAMVLALACLLPPSGSLSAQQTLTGSRLTIELHLGGVVGGPGASLVRELERVGFDERPPCLFSCAEPRGDAGPARNRPSPSGSLSLRASVSERWAVSGGIGLAEIGGASGHRDTGDYVLGQSVYSRWTDVSAWFLVHRRLSSRFDIGAGPSRHRLSTWSDHAQAATRPGFSLQLDLRTKGKLFWSARARAHYIIGDDVPHGREGFTTLEPRTSNRWEVILRPRWHYLNLQIGIGLAL